MRAHEFISEDLLNEILNQQLDFAHDELGKMAVNHKEGNKIFPGHTAVASTSAMDQAGLQVLRMQNSQDHSIEYHLSSKKYRPGEKPPAGEEDVRALAHAMNFIFNDSQSYLDRGLDIKLLAANARQHQNYLRLASKMVDRFNKTKTYGLTVTDLGITTGITGTEHPTTLVHHPKTLKMNALTESYWK